MKRRSGLGIAIGGLAAVALSGAALAFSGPTNANFETGTYVANGFGYDELNAGDPSLDGWSVDAGSIDWVGTYWPAQDGSMSIDMNGIEPATLSQTFATTIGNTYAVSFYLSGNPAGPPDVKTLDVSATGGTVSGYSYDASANTLSHMNWTQETYSFLATGTSTTLSFISTTSGAYGPALDNVVVTESVPTKDDCKHGGWRTMIDGAGNHFKNQGDCVSYFATKGKNPGALPPATSPVSHGNAHPDKANAKHGNAHHDKATDTPGKVHHDKATDKHGAKSNDAKDKKSHQADPANGSHSKHSK